MLFPPPRPMGYARVSKQPRESIRNTSMVCIFWPEVLCWTVMNDQCCHYMGWIHFYLVHSTNKWLHAFILATVYEARTNGPVPAAGEIIYPHPLDIISTSRIAGPRQQR
jgi:hypothetical protein